MRPLVVTLLLGCGRINFDPAGEPGDAMGGDPDDGSLGSCAIGGGGCPVQFSTIGNGTLNRSGNTPTGAGAHQGSCGGAGAGEVTLEVMAMVSGVYTFSTAGSAIPTALYIRDSCTGKELACDEKEVTIALSQGQRAVVFVDGGAPGVCGDHVLAVTRQ